MWTMDWIVYFNWDFIMWNCGNFYVNCCKTKWVWPLGKACACYEHELLMMLIMNCCALGMGLRVFDPEQNLFWMSCNDLSDWVCVDEWFFKMVFST